MTDDEFWEAVADDAWRLIEFYEQFPYYDWRTNQINVPSSLKKEP